MKSFSIQEQMNACITHANRNGLSIDNVNIYPNGSANHQVIVYVGGERKTDGVWGHQYISVAVLMNMSRWKKGEFDGGSESTWDANRN